MVPSMKPALRKHNGRTQWCYDWMDDSGARHRVYDDDKTRAQQKLIAFVSREEQAPHRPQAKLHSRKVGTRGNPTVSQAVERWLQGSEKIGDSSRTKYRNNYRNHLANLIGERPVKKLTTGEVQAAFSTLKGQRIGQSAYYHTWTEFHSCLNWLVFSGIISKNPMDKMEKPTRDNKISIKDDKNIERWESTVIGIVNWLDNKKNPYHKYLGLVLALNLGLRRAEVLGITTERISKSEMTLNICNQLEMRAGGAYIKPSTKGTKGELHGRTIPLPPKYYAAFKEEMDKHQHEKDAGLINVELRGEVVDRQHLLFIRDDGKPYSYNDLRNIWIEIQEAYKAKILHEYEPLNDDERIRLHGNRHIACSLLAYQGESLQTIQAILGHLTPQMTMHYTHYATKQLKRTTDAYSKMMFNDNAKNFVEALSEA